MPLGMTGEGIAPKTPMPSPENRAERLSTSPEGRGKKSAFSLVELSIVLVILGLLTGGILAGQSLIRASELRAVTSEYQRYTAATNTFRDKYFALPGDMNNATRFWGRLTANADCVTNSAAGVGLPGSCDGNGDGVIGYGAVANGSGELFQVWRQLANAGLIEGNYTGLAGPTAPTAGYDAALGSNVPKSKLSNGGWSIQNFANFGGDSYFYAGDFGNVLFFGGQNPGNSAFVPILKPEEAWNIDTKLDDGKPGTGRIISTQWNSICATSTAFNDYTGSYNLSSASKSCALMFTKAL